MPAFAHRPTGSSATLLDAAGSMRHARRRPQPPLSGRRADPLAEAQRAPGRRRPEGARRGDGVIATAERPAQAQPRQGRPGRSRPRRSTSIRRGRCSPETRKSLLDLISAQDRRREGRPDRRCRAAKLDPKAPTIKYDNASRLRGTVAELEDGARGPPKDGQRYQDVGPTREAERELRALAKATRTIRRSSCSSRRTPSRAT